MESRVALISIILTNPDTVGVLNDILHKHSRYILGRMGIPYREKNIYIISVAVDAPGDVINAISGAVGRIDGASCKVAYSAK